MIFLVFSGHGYAIVKHPRLKLLAKLKKIALEVCPISNQLLDLLSDMRNHPAASLFQENQPMVISRYLLTYHNSQPPFFAFAVHTEQSHYSRHRQ